MSVSTGKGFLPLWLFLWFLLFFYPFGFVFALLEIECLRAEDVVHCTNCKAHRGNVTVIWAI